MRHLIISGGNAYALQKGKLITSPMHVDGFINIDTHSKEWYEVDYYLLSEEEKKQPLEVEAKLREIFQ